jgi:predicted ribosome quality control (RQC) complex YloA/Tae2 family protein
MGKDKFENEDLIKFGWPEDIWFHVDDLSSAHVYLRLKEGESWDKIDEKLIAECCQLVKANSIEGSKKDFVKVVYTPWENLFKGK